MIHKIMPSVTAILALTLAAAPAAEAKTTPSPRPWLESVIDRAQKLATKNFEAKSAAETKWKSEIKETIDDILDWNELTERALGRHWKKRTPAEQVEFAKLLREMIEASYQSKLRLAATKKTDTKAKVEIEWLDEKVEKDTATSTARFKVGKSVAVLEFKMSYANDRWRVYDVSIDDVSTVRTYRSQFGKIIGKEGYAALVERLRSKTDEIRSGRADISPP